MNPKGLIGLNMAIAAYFGYEVFGNFGIAIGFIGGGIIAAMLYTLLTPEKIIAKSGTNSTAQVKLSAIVLLILALVAAKFNTELHGTVLLWFKDYFVVAALAILLILTLYRFIQSSNVVEDFYFHEDTNIHMIISFPVNLLILLWVYAYFVN